MRKKFPSWQFLYGTKRLLRTMPRTTYHELRIGPRCSLRSSESRHFAFWRAKAGLDGEGEANKHATASHFFGIGVLSAQPSSDIKSSHLRLKRMGAPQEDQCAQLR
jgi:hypothetical protein